MYNKLKINNFVVVILSVVFIFFIIFFWVMPKVRENGEKISESKINNFEDCVAEGNPVMESYPRQCASQGVTFVEEIANNLREESKEVSIANPASKNCLDLGGTVEMRENKVGQYGVCLFEDNRQCEEWALFRRECPVGGLKITGYENEAEIYCAITGGQVEIVGEAMMCKRVDGTYCNAQSNFDGDCPAPDDPEPEAL